MGFFHHDDSDEQQAYDTVQREGSTCKYLSIGLMIANPLTRSDLTAHELVAGAASFMAMRKYEERQEQEGKPERSVKHGSASGRLWLTSS
jgi:hypothetical protein